MTRSSVTNSTMFSFFQYPLTFIVTKYRHNNNTLPVLRRNLRIDRDCHRQFDRRTLRSLSSRMFDASVTQYPLVRCFLRLQLWHSKLCRNDFIMFTIINRVRWYCGCSFLHRRVKFSSTLQRLAKRGQQDENRLEQPHIESVTLSPKKSPS